MDVDDNNMIYLHDPHTEYTDRQVREMHYEGNCVTDCPHCNGGEHNEWYTNDRRTSIP